MLKIGLSACFFHADPQRPIFKGKTLQYLEQSMAHWVMSADVMAVMIPSPEGNIRRGKVSVSDYARELDGLVLQGGSDVSPQSYGEEALRPEWRGDRIRDLYEIDLLRAFTDAGKPVLGVCRGAQLINVAFGGTLYQDIATQRPGALTHRDWEIYDQNFHGLRVTHGSGLARHYATDRIHKVNSVHHQGVKDLAPGLAVEARAEEDGMVEAVRATGPAWVLGVQWHPEFHDPADASLLDDRPILDEFLKAGRERR
ncbi:MAG: gamma-glutamyl-gamma-aminobutyrate hydrolase family protein [Betaproteobacteria bacterium]|nr:gamma-glutamyl-gamma-aminobutyrate hydrolase family protein [Betaproteobacteria bacterium]